MHIFKNSFAHAEGGTRIFLRMPRGGDQKKLATHDHRQTAPLPVKNDSSLRPLNGDVLRNLNMYSYPKVCPV